MLRTGLKIIVTVHFVVKNLFWLLSAYQPIKTFLGISEKMLIVFYDCTES